MTFPGLRNRHRASATTAAAAPTRQAPSAPIAPSLQQQQQPPAQQRHQSIEAERISPHQPRVDEGTGMLYQGNLPPPVPPPSIPIVTVTPVPPPSSHSDNTSDYYSNRDRRNHQNAQYYQTNAASSHRSTNPDSVTNDNDKFAQQSSYLIPATVRMIAGCHTAQTSADVQNILRQSSTNLPHPAGKAGGACTSALLDILYREHYDNQQRRQQLHTQHQSSSNHDNGMSHNQRQQQLQSPQPTSSSSYTFQQLLLDLRSKLASQGHDQIPQLSSSRPLDVEHAAFDLGGTGTAGTKRACLIGINYRGQDGQLRGCHNDVYNMQKYLIDVQGFSPEHILLLIDNDPDQLYHNTNNGTSSRHCHPPTRQNIIHALQRLVAESVAGDAVFVLYSGHGGLLEPKTNWFKKGLFRQKQQQYQQSNPPSAIQKEYDETLYPVDHQVSGQIRDFNLYRHFVQPMPAGVVVTAVMDCCHSGTVLDLPYSFQPTNSGTIRVQRSMDHLANVGMLYLLMGGMFPSGGNFASLTNHIQGVTGVGDVEDYQGLGLGDDEDVDNYTNDDNGIGYGEGPGLDGVGEDAAPDIGGPTDIGRGFDTDSPDAGGSLPPPIMPSDFERNDPGQIGNDWTTGGVGEGGDGGGAFDDGCDLFNNGCDDGDADCGCLTDLLSNILNDDN